MRVDRHGPIRCLRRSGKLVFFLNSTQISQSSSPSINEVRSVNHLAFHSLCSVLILIWTNNACCLQFCVLHYFASTLLCTSTIVLDHHYRQACMNIIREPHTHRGGKEMRKDLGITVNFISFVRWQPICIKCAFFESVGTPVFAYLSSIFSWAYRSN